MSLKFKFDEMRRNDPTQPATNSEGGMSGNEFYPADGYARNICFIPSQDYMLFLSYSHLISGEFTIDDQQINLTFTSHSVTLQGLKLDTLFHQLMNHLPRMIVVADERYNVVQSQNAPVVNLIKIIDLSVEK